MPTHSTCTRLSLLAALLALAPYSRANAPRARVADGDFERTALRFVNTDQPGAWRAFKHGRSDAEAALAPGEGRAGSRAVRYTRTTPGSDNFHLDQLVEVEPGATYELAAWTRGDGRLNPVLSVMAMNWRVLAAAPSNASNAWTRVALLFDTGSNDRVRLEWFPGAQGQLYQGGPGTAWLDDVTLAKLEQVPPDLRRALDLAQPRASAATNLLRPASAELPARPPAARGSLPPITCRDGVLRYPDGHEVSLWGVNLQTALSWEYFGRLKSVGVPLEPEALRRVADQNLDEVVKLRASVIRMHLVPSDFTDAEGRLREGPFLDALDYTLAGCRRRGLYVYLTLMNEMGRPFHADSCFANRDRREWLADPALADTCVRYVRNLLERVNPYTRTAYKDEAALAVLELANEPGYVDFAELCADPRFSAHRRRFEAWCAERGGADHLDLRYRTFRYEQVRGHIDRLCAAIRSLAPSKPVIWNLNWPQMLNEHADVFQAAADSTADGVSFCLYPGQSDVPQAYWSHPADLSGKNYLPFLKTAYATYERLGWALDPRFAKKAKLVYEFETFFNQSSYLYPAMARLFRALGVQAACMWTYSLTPAAERLAGSHHLNLYCTPQKAASFAIAGEVMLETPRYAPLAWTGDDALAFGSCAVSFARNFSVWRSADTYMQSRPGNSSEPSAGTRRVLACGSSPYAAYDGTGLYALEFGPERAELELNPDAEFVWPPWETRRKTPWETVTRLDASAPHRFTLRHPAWRSGVRVWRVDANGTSPVETENGSATFTARPGRYRFERARP